jgi:hypothetical protein
MSYDPLAFASKLRAHEIFAGLRRDCPVHHHEMPAEELDRQAANTRVAAPTREFWSVLRYDDCARVLQSPEQFSNLQGPGPERRVRTGTDGMLLVADDPAHRRQRQIANKGFLPRVVQARTSLIQGAADDLLDGVAPRGRADVMTELSIPLTVAMITDFFGAGGDRRDDIARWGSAIVGANGGDRAAVEASTEAITGLMTFIVGIVNERRAESAAGRDPANDVLTALINAEHEGKRFTDEEICVAAMQFLSAGFETTATAIGSAVQLLCTHPSERAKLEADWSLLDNACEEILRFESPVEGTFRTANCPVTVGGEDLPADAKVRIVYASANRDETRFPDAGAFRIDRPATELRRHIAFGHGPHACIGSALARAELRIALRTVLTRLPGLELDPDRPPLRNASFTVNGYSSVPIVWDTGMARPRES